MIDSNYITVTILDYPDIVKKLIVMNGYPIDYAVRKKIYQKQPRYLFTSAYMFFFQVRDFRIYLGISWSQSFYRAVLETGKNISVKYFKEYFKEFILFFIFMHRGWIHKICSVSLRVQSEYGKITNRKNFEFGNSLIGYSAALSLNVFYILKTNIF